MKKLFKGKPKKQIAKKCLSCDQLYRPFTSFSLYHSMPFQNNSGDYLDLTHSIDKLPYDICPECVVRCLKTAEFKSEVFYKND